MKILITGATGLVGKALVAHLSGRGHVVHFLTLKSDELEIFGDKAKGFLWNPQHNIFDLDSIRGVEAIIHLAGAPISSRWTEEYKKDIIDSRVQSAVLLSDVLRKHDNSVKQFVSASAIGIYQDRKNFKHDEASTKLASGFLSDVVKKWEAAADSFSKMNISVCKIRTGLVLAKQGGALPQLAKPIKWGVGAPMGSGKQIQSWIHLDDLVGIYTFAVENKLEGTYNAVAPNPVTNSYLTKSIAKQLKRPLWLPNIPEFALKLALGEMHALLVESQDVSSGKIAGAGYDFLYTDVNQALAAIYA